MMGADVMGHQDFSRHGGRSAPTYSEDTGAAMQPHMDQKLFEQQFGNRQPAAGQSYDQRRSPPYIPQDQFSSPGMMQHRPTAGEGFPPSGDINTIEAMKRSSGLVTSGQRAEEMVLHTSVAQERVMPTYASGSPKQLVSPPSNARLSASPSDNQKPVQTTSDAAPYGLYSDTAHLKSDQDFSGGHIGGTNLMGSRETELGTQKGGIHLQHLGGGTDDATAQSSVRALEERLRKAEHERDESKRSMERTNAQLNNRIRRLEQQLTSINSGTSNEVSQYVYICTVLYIVVSINRLLWQRR